MAWLRQRDPGLRAVRRAVRVTLVACLGFYTCQYLLGNSVMAIYALFGAVALGTMTQLPGTPADRARTLLWALPVGYLLITLGTLLAVRTWAAALGMFVLGFAVAYAGVGGPRLVGLANGMQLLYILPCFPPYAPQTLGWRLAGFTIAAVLLAAAERVLWPDPASPPYELRLAETATVLGSCIDTAVAALAGEPGARDRLAALLSEAEGAAEAIRPSRLPSADRPASAGRRQRALSHGGATTRYTLCRISDLLRQEQEQRDSPAPAGAETAELLRQSARTVRAAAGALRDTGPPPDLAPMTAALARFRAARLLTPTSAPDPDRLRLSSLALVVARGATVLATTVRVAVGAPIPPDPTPPAARPGLYWYAYEPAALLWWRRFRSNLTPRSVHFQGALRLAVALAVARLLAGGLNLEHGFWVLLATLTVLRSRSADTRAGLRPVLVGTLAGATLAGAVLALVQEPLVYSITLPVVMVVAFASVQVLGPGWAQCLFTVLIAMVFAQVAPVSWQLAELRVLDVLIGAGVGVVIGFCAWPRGGTGELRLATANFLAAGALTVRETVAVLTHAAPPGSALPQARRSMMLAEASYGLYQTERPGTLEQGGGTDRGDRPGPATASIDWQAAMIAGDHVVRGAEVLLSTCTAGRMLPWAAWLSADADAVARGYDGFAAGLRQDRPVTAIVAPVDATVAGYEAEEWPTDLGTDLYQLADLRVWLSGLGDDLTRITDHRGSAR